VLLERHNEIARGGAEEDPLGFRYFRDFDDGLNTAVKKIRDVLGDSSERPRYIETIRDVGTALFTRSSDRFQTRRPEEFPEQISNQGLLSI